MIRQLAIAAAVCAAAPAAADTLIGFTDTSPHTYSIGFLNETGANWAASWTQTSGYRDVALTAMLSSNVQNASANWWLSRVLGPAATIGDVVASGSYTAPYLLSASAADYNALTPSTLATGLRLDPGTYFLVIGGAAGPYGNNGEWIGDYQGESLTLAAGFNLVGYGSTTHPAAFGPSATFIGDNSASFFVFGLTGSAVPEPASWALLIAGFGLTGAALRRRPTVLAQ